jgi:NAD(P)-dependent dehydrogenase (short-subunit alcohol dehydrogenase family)
MPSTTAVKRLVPIGYKLARLPSLKGKVAIVTSTCHDPDDVGWHIAYQLALRGAKV